MNKKVALITLGCKLNYAETSTYERGLVKAGCEAVSWTETGIDLFLVNTCSVTEHSDKKSRNIIRKLHRTVPQAAIVVTGCSAQLRREAIEAIDGVAKVFGAAQKNEVVPYCLALLGLETAKSGVAGAKQDKAGQQDAVAQVMQGKAGQQDAAESQQGKAEQSEEAQLDNDFFGAYSSGERTRSFLKVQDGCDYKCHYCTVPYARGESRNAPIHYIISQAEAIAAEGIKEIVITGVNTGDFGKSTGESFLDLLKALDKVSGIERYRISSIEPNLLTEEIVDWIARGSKVLPHFHIPLQSGCDTILSAMGRRYTTADFAAKIAYIRKRLEKEGRQKVFFGIDVIVGFPGETDEMFRTTYDFLANTIKPAFIHIFPYSRRPGTPAAERRDQIQDSVKTARVEALEALCEKLHNEFILANKGKESKVLFELKSKSGAAEGWSENYIRVSVPYEEGIINEIRKVTL